MFISRKKYDELTNRLDSMHKLLGDVLAHTGNVIDTNSELLQTCKDLIQMNKNLIKELEGRLEQNASTKPGTDIPNIVI